jgi:NAD-dependent deacetylase
MRTWQKAEEASKNCDLMLVAGTSLEVMPSAGLPMRAVENGACLILVNRTPTYIDVRAELIIQGDVAQIIPRIAANVLGE